ncbi:MULTISPECIES: hypothetical protein [unclassified Streptomyces]|uniref:hypothetical protein n=1 Tax=unclassified Streptomyces TaxID=2593676 RepID=UPI0029A5E781|nr:MULTISPECIES: hypothetical protein [unclassified Streptomyces]MDX3772147.1 hypothetical protein [Streptomyces sp. AK08-01B]MDX3821674.1 hypothetical protein [Streptomyces sp. AK08-01A]
MVNARHAEVVKLSAGDDQFEVEYARLVSNAERLLQFERTIPERLAEPSFGSVSGPSPGRGVGRLWSALC